MVYSARRMNSFWEIVLSPMRAMMVSLAVSSFFPQCKMSKPTRTGARVCENWEIKRLIILCLFIVKKRLLQHGQFAYQLFFASLHGVNINPGTRVNPETIFAIPLKCVRAGVLITIHQRSNFLPVKIINF